MRKLLHILIHKVILIIPFGYHQNLHPISLKSQNPSITPPSPASQVPNHNVFGARDAPLLGVLPRQQPRVADPLRRCLVVEPALETCATGMGDAEDGTIINE